MKKFFTLAFMAFSFCLTTAADVVLGDIQFSLAEGKKISPTTGKILVTFPSVEGVDIATTTFSISGIFDAPGEDNDVDFELEETFAHGITFDLKDFELQASTEYALRITSVVVNEVELAPEGGFVLNFKTRGAERKMSYSFQTDAEAENLISEILGESGNDYWSIGSKGRIQSKVCFTDEEVTLDGTTVVPFLEDLLITNVNATGMLLGQTASSSNNRLHLAQPKNKVVVPDCQVGDRVAVRFSYVDTKKEYSIQIPNATCDAATNAAKDSVPSPKSAATFVFKVHTAGDLTIIVNNSCLYSIEITEAQPEVPRKYRVVAAYTENDNQAELKELVPLTEGTTGSSIKANYPYWLTDKNNVAYTHGSKGSEFAEVFDLKNGLGDAPYADTTFVINYTKTDFKDVVYLSEAEDIEGTTLCVHDNVAVRSSMAKAAYPAEGDIKLVTLQPGSYKIRAVLFDGNKTASYTCILSKGEQPEDEIWLSASSTNFDEKESPLITLTEETDITWIKQGEGDSKGLDCIMIYRSEDAPEDPMAVSEVKAAKPAVARKLMKNGQILINTEAGTFNVMGIQVR